MHTCGSVTIEFVLSFWQVLVNFRGNRAVRDTNTKLLKERGI